jgi:hypothetical protein
MINVVRAHETEYLREKAQQDSDAELARRLQTEEDEKSVKTNRRRNVQDNVSSKPETSMDKSSPTTPVQKPPRKSPRLTKKSSTDTSIELDAEVQRIQSEKEDQRRGYFMEWFNKSDSAAQEFLHDLKKHLYTDHGETNGQRVCTILFFSIS